MPRRQGPFSVIRKVTDLTYKLNLPHNLKVHPVISVQYLTPYDCRDNPFHRQPPPPGPVEYGDSDSDKSTGNEDIYEVERLIDYKGAGKRR